MTSNVAVIIRSVGERTEALCRHLVEQQVPPQHVVVIHERPFSKAVQRSFEIGLDYGLDWTLCVDADVLLREDGIQTLVEAASKLPETTFTFSGCVVDKLLGHSRPGGGHLYRTQHCQSALAFIEESDRQIRPERYIKGQMKEAGFPYVVNKQLVAGVHDFEQYYTDIYRKCFVHAHKHSYILYLPEMWKLLSKFDGDYRIALRGWKAGIQFRGDVRTDIADFPRSIDHVLRGQRLVEKEHLQLDEFKIDVDEIIKHALKEYGIWKTYEQSVSFRLKKQWHKLGAGKFIVWLAMTPIRKLKYR